MLIREIRLYKPLQEYFTQILSNRTVSNRALKPVEWQASREVVTFLDDAAQITKAIQRGHHAFVGKAINNLTVLETSLSLDTQDIRSLDPYDGPRTATAVADLLAKVQDLLKILVQDFQKRGLGLALDGVEKICLLLYPRFKSLYTAVCLNGGNYVQNEVRALMEYKFSSFRGNVTFSAGSVGTGSSGDGQGAGGPQAGEASAEGTGGGGRHRGGSRSPACYVQDRQDQSGHGQEGCPPRW